MKKDEIQITPGALAEDPPEAAAPAATGEVDEAALVAEAIAKEKATQPESRPEAESAPIGGGVSPIDAEALRAAQARDLQAIENARPETMMDVQGKPTFTPEELKFLADSAKKGKKTTAAEKERRKELHDRASGWRKRRRAELEERHRKELEEQIAGAQRKAEVAFFDGMTGGEVWELYNDGMWALDSLHVSGVEELVFSKEEIEALAGPSRDVLLKYPRFARLVLLMNLPEVRLLRALRPIVKLKVGAFAAKRAQLKAEAAAAAKEAKPALPGPGSSTSGKGAA